MDVLMIYPETKEQLTAYQSLAKAFQNRVVQRKEKKAKIFYEPEFVAKILEGREDFKNGRGTTIKTEDFWKSKISKIKNLKIKKLFKYHKWTGYWFFWEDKNGDIFANSVHHEEGDFIGCPLVIQVKQSDFSRQIIDIEDQRVLISEIRYCRTPGTKLENILQPFIDDYDTWLES